MSKLRNGDFVRDIKTENEMKADIKKHGVTLKVLISIKMDPKLLERIRKVADKEGIGYQTLIHSRLMDLFPEVEKKDEAVKLIDQIFSATNQLKKELTRKSIARKAV